MRIGIILTGDYTWAGGLYYSLNLIKLLSAISAKKQLTVVVIANEATPPVLLKDIPALNTELCFLNRKSFLYRAWHKLKNDRFAADINALKLDVLYPLISFDSQHPKINCRIFYWMYDFQHKFLSQLFSKDEIALRDTMFQRIADNAADIVFSSRDSAGHFEQFYSASKCRRHVYNFVSLLDVPKQETAEQHNYFIVCNQFWPHKNHTVVLKAIKLLVDAGQKPHFVFTGKYDDTRNKDYVDGLLSFISQNNLGTFVKLTGFISRSEQITLMKGATAVIQPSFFEGWSTVVEDAKALGKFLLLSNLPVHKEQVKTNVAFFNPENEQELSARLSDCLALPPVNFSTDYKKNIEQSEQDLIKLFNIV